MRDGAGAALIHICKRCTQGPSAKHYHVFRPPSHDTVRVMCVGFAKCERAIGGSRQRQCRWWWWWCVCRPRERLRTAYSVWNGWARSVTELLHHILHEVKRIRTRQFFLLIRSIPWLTRGLWYFAAKISQTLFNNFCINLIIFRD